MISDNNFKIENIISKKVQLYNEDITKKYNDASDEIEKKYRSLLQAVLYEEQYQKVNNDLINSFYDKCEEKLISENNKFCLSIKQSLNQRINDFEIKENLVLNAHKI